MILVGLVDTIELMVLDTLQASKPAFVTLATLCIPLMKLNTTKILLNQDLLRLGKKN